LSLGFDELLLQALKLSDVAVQGPGTERETFNRRQQANSERIKHLFHLTNLALFIKMALLFFNTAPFP
jgi:hypothetical protein